MIASRKFGMMSKRVFAMCVFIIKIASEDVGYSLKYTSVEIEHQPPGDGRLICSLK